MAPIETENNAYAKFWGDKQRELWYVMVFSGNDLQVLKLLIVKQILLVSSTGNV